MARKRMSRRELLEKDEITSRLHQSTTYLVERRKPILMAVGVVIAVAIIAVGWNVYAASREANSQNALSAVIRVYNDTEGYPSERDRYQAALAEAQNVVDAYPSMAAGRIARYYMALSHDALGNTAEAERMFQELIASGDETIRQVARHALAESYKKRGELESAVAAYQELRDAGGYSEGMVLYELGWLHEALEKPDEARSYYQQLVGEHPDSPFRDDADRALKRLGSGETASAGAES